MVDRLEMNVGTLGLRTARRAKVTDNIPHICSYREAVVMHTQHWTCRSLNNMQCCIFILPFVDYVIFTRPFSFPFFCTASGKKLGGRGAWERGLEWTLQFRLDHCMKFDVVR